MVKYLLDIVLYTSVFISLGGAALIIRSYIIFDYSINWGVTLFVFFSTLFTYNLTKIIPLWKFWNNSKEVNYAYNERSKWNAKHKNKLSYITTLSLIAIVYFTFELGFYQLLFLSHLGIISLLYAAPVFSGRGLRTFPLIKIFLIAYVWASISIMPIVSNIESFNLKLALLFLENFCFVLAITIPFDIRDYSRDKSQEIKTLPSVLGISKAKWLSAALLLFSSIVGYFIIESTCQKILNICINMLFLPIMVASKEKYKEYYYLGLIDGTLIIRLFILFI